MLTNQFKVHINSHKNFNILEYTSSEALTETKYARELS